MAEIDDKRTEREEWAESEANQFDKNANAIEDCIEGWLKNPKFHPNLQKAAEIAIKVETWREAARSLRKPYYARIERRNH